MRETRTYGLMRGRWSARCVRQTGVYSTRPADAVCRREPHPSQHLRVLDVTVTAATGVTDQGPGTGAPETYT